MLSKIKSVVPKFIKAVPSRGFATQVGNKDLAAQNTDRAVSRSQRLQFSKEKLTEFGDLPLGEIPEALKYNRPFSTFLVVSHKNNSIFFLLY